ASSAQRGWASMSKQNKEKVLGERNRFLSRTLKHNMELSDEYDSKALVKIARGALLQNAAERTDKGIQTIKTIASLDETGMIKPQMQTGVIIIQAVNIPAFDSVPNADGTPRLPEGANAQ